MNLFPEQKGKFLAVVDFAQKGFEKERDIQIQALRETCTEHIILEKSLTIDEIRAIYRKASLFFLSFRESFGLPIVELQLCGSYIVSPYEKWVPSHYIKNIYNKGGGRLSHNFIIYNNNLDILKSEINRIKAIYDPEQVKKEFETNHPHFHHGDLSELKRFIENVKNGDISPRSHKRYYWMNKEIVTEL